MKTKNTTDISKLKVRELARQGISTRACQYEAVETRCSAPFATHPGATTAVGCAKCMKR